MFSLSKSLLNLPQKYKRTSLFIGLVKQEGGVLASCMQWTHVKFLRLLLFSSISLPSFSLLSTSLFFFLFLSLPLSLLLSLHV